MPEQRSPLQTIAVICVKLDQGEPEEKILEYLEIDHKAVLFFRPIFHKNHYRAN